MNFNLRFQKVTTPNKFLDPPLIGQIYLLYKRIVSCTCLSGMVIRYLEVRIYSKTTCHKQPYLHINPAPNILYVTVKIQEPLIQ